MIQPETIAEEHLVRHARASFPAYRRLMNPRMLWGWWQSEICHELQGFYESLRAGERPTLIIEAPPQHGKSSTIADFIAWVAGQNPDLRTIFASFSDRLGVRCNLRLQRSYSSAIYGEMFPETMINVSNKISASEQTLRNRSIIEYARREGYFRNTTVRGPVTGESLDLGVVDDPIKGRLEANSETFRQGAWDWLTDDFMTRFDEKAGLLMILTRWHVDDPAGRLIESEAKSRVLSHPAVAIEDEVHRKKGEALFPELKSLAFLDERKAAMTPDSWEALYQQSPYIRTGGLFPVDRFQIVEHKPNDIDASVRYWDKAGTADGGAYTAGVLMHRLDDGRYCVSDVKRKQLSALDRERMIMQTAEIDGKDVRVMVEQEPGSGGKESAEATIRMLAGWRVEADRPVGDKVTRAEPYAAQVQGSNVLLCRGEWNMPFIREHQSFPHGYKDQVDAAAAAFAGLNKPEVKHDFW